MPWDAFNVSRVEDIEDYIKVKELDKIFKAVLVKCFRQRPENPAGFVMDYLIETYPEEAAIRFGTRPGGGEETDSQVSITVTHQDPDANEYLNRTLDIGSLFSHLSQQVVATRPEEPMDFMCKVMQVIRQSQEDETELTTDGGNTTQGEDMYDDFVRRVSITGRRSSVSAECTDMATLGGDQKVETRVVEKTAAERDEILVSLQENILFKDLCASLQEQVVGAVFPVNFSAGTTIIKQGDEGDNLYIVRTGEAMVFMMLGTDTAPKHLITYGPLSTFGELALMYGNKRAATVKAKSDVKTWALDRITFRHVVYSNMNARREAHQGFLKRVPVLSMLTEQQQSLVADVLQTIKYEPGTPIITQGDPGAHFYILEEGECQAIYSTPEGEKMSIRQYNQQGDYFGELAFLTKANRACGVVAVTAVTCVAMDKASFKRLLGPCEAYLRNNIAGYRAVIDNYVGSVGVFTGAP